MNPWTEKLGCEVNVCQAKQCDEARMKVCALRKAYLWRVNMLVAKLKRLQNSPFRKGIVAQLKELGADKWLQKTQPQKQDPNATN